MTQVKWRGALRGRPCVPRVDMLCLLLDSWSAQEGVGLEDAARGPCLCWFVRVCESHQASVKARRRKMHPQPFSLASRKTRLWGGVHFRNATASRNGPFSVQPPECRKTLRRASEKRVSCEACCGRAEVRLKILQQEREYVC